LSANRRGRSFVAAAAVALALTRSGVAVAQNVTDPPAGAVLPSELRAGIGVQRPYWSAGEPRPFLAGIFESGGISLRTELDAGWGRPHYAWAGGELTTQLSLRGVTIFSGLRGVLPFGSLRAGARYFLATQQRFLPPNNQLTRPELEIDEGQRTRYLSLDGELQFEIPLPVGTLGGLVSAHGMLGVPDPFFVYEEALRAVVDPPFVARGRVQYLAGIGDPPTFRLGGIVDTIVNPSREAVWVRTGPAIAISLTHHLEAVGVAALTLLSPDEIGLAGADLGQIGLRYRWATGDLWPEFP
jgi:hypothetical protein